MLWSEKNEIRVSEFIIMAYSFVHLLAELHYFMLHTLYLIISFLFIKLCLNIFPGLSMISQNLRKEINLSAINRCDLSEGDDKVQNINTTLQVSSIIKAKYILFMHIFRVDVSIFLMQALPRVTLVFSPDWLTENTAGLICVRKETPQQQSGACTRASVFCPWFWNPTHVPVWSSLIVVTQTSAHHIPALPQSHLATVCPLSVCLRCQFVLIWRRA